MKIEMVETDRIVPYARNPRKNTAAVDKVAASLREFGFRQPIVVDREMTVIAGHTRLLAAKKLGLTEVPIHIAEGLTETQIKAYRIADNRIGAEASWDADLLKLEMTDLQNFGIDVALTGFDAGELEKIMYDELNPEQFDSYGEDIETNHECPKCGYKWS